MSRIPDELRGFYDAGAAAAAEGARAAGLLAKTCRTVLAHQDSARLEVVRELALDIERELDALAGSAAEEGAAVPDLLAEAALRCADLATLAACNSAQLRIGAGTVVHLAAGAARALSFLVEAGPEKGRAGILDVRGVVWKVGLAVRQLEGSSG